MPSEPVPNSRQSGSVERPAYGAEQILLLRAKSTAGGKYRIVRQVYTDTGWTTSYDPEKKDWINWAGSWKDVETLAIVDSQEEATAFMVERSGAGA